MDGMRPGLKVFPPIKAAPRIYRTSALRPPLGEIDKHPNQKLRPPLGEIDKHPNRKPRRVRQASTRRHVTDRPGLSPPSGVTFPLSQILPLKQCQFPAPPMRDLASAASLVWLLKKNEHQLHDGQAI